MKQFITLLTIIISLQTLQSQTTLCDSLKNQPLHHHEIKDETSRTWLYEKFYSLTDCGLDSVDVFLILEGTLFDALVATAMKDNPAGIITFNDLLKGYAPVLAQKEFSEIKEKLAILLPLINQKVSTENWPKTKATIIELEVNTIDLEHAENRLNKAIEHGMTYKDFFEKLEKSSPVLESTPSNYSWQFMNLDYEEAVELSRWEDKPLILFFTGFACVNAVKMQDLVLFDERVRPILNKEFIFVPLYVDSKAATIDGSHPNVGKKNEHLQQEKFGTNFQPYFVMLDQEGNILGTSEYTPKIDEFLAFLKIARE